MVRQRHLGRRRTISFTCDHPQNALPLAIAQVFYPRVLADVLVHPCARVVVGILEAGGFQRLQQRVRPVA